MTDYVVVQLQTRNPVFVVQVFGLYNDLDEAIEEANRMEDASKVADKIPSSYHVRALQPTGTSEN